ncbi:MAG: 4-hydroxy-tetrahydrodipicolinate reductase [bacterium]
MAQKKIRVVVSGASGRMGRQVVCAVSAEKDMRVVGGVDVVGVGRDVGKVAGIGKAGAEIAGDIKAALGSVKPDVVVDFTTAEGFEKRAGAVLDAGCRLVVGTTGIDDSTIKKLSAKAERKKLGVIIAPNFAIGAVLMMKFAREAVEFLSDVEIIELHHDKKADAPSGTALYTARLIAGAKKGKPLRKDPTKLEKLKGCRGGALGDISIHSVRLPGYLAHQEVIFGGPGQTLTIRHDTTSRESFMPGVIFAVRRVMKMDRLVAGLENLI